MRRPSISAALLACAFLAACAKQEPARPPQSASSAEAASNGLTTLRKLVNASNYRSMGFESQDELRSASLGDPLRAKETFQRVVTEYAAAEDARRAQRYLQFIAKRYGDSPQPVAPSQPAPARRGGQNT